MPFRYHNDEAKTAAAQHPEHPTWTTVGDLGYVDEEGYLYLTDRKAFMIISGGVNIYPQEVEDLFSLHPKVLDIARGRGARRGDGRARGRGGAAGARRRGAARRSPPSCGTTPASGSRTSRCRPSSTSPRSFREPRRASW